MVDLGAQGPKTNLDVAEAFAVGQLGESHGDKLMAEEKLTTLVSAAVSLHTRVEVATWKKIHELRKDELPIEHKTTLPFPAAENPPSRRPNVLPN